MSLTPGTRFGPYEITTWIGAGGMGEVYRARDPRLGRDVAIKVISRPLEHGDHGARFEREARTLAALNHPNIASIYGLDTIGDQKALVMELVEGPTLADRIALGAIPVEEALPIAIQITEALEAAHALGIVHRDLKPANVKVRPDGTVKVLDFGLAKALEPPRASVDHSQAPTITTPAVTQAGIILGTAPYMSPEQVKGSAVDRRSDVWAFGCVLYEMLTGRPAFAGSDVAETLASVLRADVDWSRLPASLSPVTRAFAMRCLVRDPRHRLHDIADMRLALQGMFDDAHTHQEHAGSPAPPRPMWRRALPIAAAVVLTALVTWLAVWGVGRRSEPPTVSRLQMTLPPGQPFYFNGRHLVTISPDGRLVAYTAGLGLWIHPIDRLEASRVPGAELEARSPFFSADGQSIGYYASGELKRVSVTGGAPVTLTRAVNPWGASWGNDDVIYYGQGPDGIWRIAGAGGEAEQVVSLNAGEMAQSPQLLPGDEWLLFTLLPSGVGSWNRAKIVLHALATGERVTLVDGGSDARYLRSGHLVYALNSVLLVAPFDVGARRLTGGAVPVVRDVFDAGNVTGAAHFSVSDNGSLVYAPRIDTALRLTWVDRNGREQPIPGDLRPYRHPRISPDGTRIAVEVEDPGNTDIWVGDARDGTFTRLTREEDIDSDPIWTPDGSHIVFSSVRDPAGLFRQAADGSGAVEHLADGSGGVRGHSWMPDGKLIFEELAGSQIKVLDPGSGAAPQEISVFEAPEYFNELLPQISPDGGWLAYQSTESGEMEVYVRPFPNVSEGRRQISVGGGFAPLWSPDGREIFYRSTASLMAVEVRTSPTFASGTPVVLFGLGDFVLAGPRGIRYDVGPDGRFLLLKDETGYTGSQERIVLVQNWAEELVRLVPTN